MSSNRLRKALQVRDRLAWRIVHALNSRGWLKPADLDSLLEDARRCTAELNDLKRHAESETIWTMRQQLIKRADFERAAESTNDTKGGSQ